MSPVEVKCPPDRGAFVVLEDGRVLVVCGCGWWMDSPSKRAAKMNLSRHRVQARGERWLKAGEQP